MTALAASVGERFADTALSGPLLLAAPVALIAGLVSFLSPCVLPLVPGYLSYLTGLSGADLDAALPPPATGPQAGGAATGTTTTQAPVQRTALLRSRVLLGSVLFVLGFTVVFVSFGAFFGGIGNRLLEYQVVVDRVLGALTVVLGLAFLGVVPGMQREFKVHRLPRAGLAGAPLLGVLFGVGWTPCLGPTLAAVQTLAFSSATAGRGALLTAFYCAGLGLPFILAAVAYRRAMGAFAVVRRHSRLVTRIGGGMLIVVGLLLLTGIWARLIVEMQVLVSSTETLI